MPTSVVLGTDPVNGPRYSYVYNGHGDVVALTDATGTVVASYSYDAFGGLTASSESFPNNTAGWSNPYRYDGRDGVRYDGETGLYWLSVRAYDPALGRFLQHDPLGRAPLYFADQPYAYAGNNPLINVDPSGQRFGSGFGSTVRIESAAHRLRSARLIVRRWHSCRSDLRSPGTGGICRTYHGWMLESQQVRRDKYLPEFFWGAAFVVAGAGVTIWADWGAFQNLGDAKSKFAAIKDMIATFALTVIPMLAQVADLLGWDWALSWANGLATVFHAVSGVVDWAMAAVNAFGWLASSVIGAAITAIGKLLGGVPGMVMGFVEGLVEKMGMASVLQFLHGAGHALEAIGYGMLTQWAADTSGPIWTWCEHNGGACAPEPDSGYWYWTANG